MTSQISYSAMSMLRPIWWRIRRALIPAQIPCNPDGSIRLHLGCGEINATGYVNIDLRPEPHVHFVHDIYPLEMFPDNSADLIYASHVLEHLPLKKVKYAIAEWYRVLKSNGVLRLAVPDFGVITQMYREHVSLDILLGPLMGAQHYEENYHKSAFDESYLRRLMSETGFRRIQKWDPKTVSWHDFMDGSNKSYEINEKQYLISLNLQGVKE